MQPSQPSIPQNMQQPIPQQNPYAAAAAVTQQSLTNEKRQKRPLIIKDPVSHQPVDFPSQSPASSTSATTTSSSSSSTITATETRSAETNTTDSAVSQSKSINDTNKTQKQADFRRQFAEIIGDSFSAQTDKV